MSTWHYRILRYPEGGCGLYEVYCDEDGNPTSWTTEPAEFSTAEDKGKDEIVKALELALADAKKRPLLQISNDGQTLLPLADPVGHVAFSDHWMGRVWQRLEP